MPPPLLPPPPLQQQQGQWQVQGQAWQAVQQLMLRHQVLGLQWLLRPRLCCHA
jgi:hypothetical protein